jgi:hypothetical protein
VSLAAREAMEILAMRYHGAIEDQIRTHAIT